METRCSRCSQPVSAQRMGRCPNCGGVVMPAYSDEEVLRLAQIQPGPGIGRYRELLPVSENLPFLGEGDTPLIASHHLGKSLGLSRLYFKHEGCNPSGSFKDRGGALCAALALESGAKGMVTASTGNAAAAISAYCAAVGLPCLLLLEPGVSPAKLRQALATGARAVCVEGVFSRGPDALQALILGIAARLGYYPAFFWAPINPCIVDAFKTLSYEIAARLPGAPDVVVCPTGGGDGLVGQWRGYMELHRAGVVETLPKMIAVQSLSAPPLLKAFENGSRQVALLGYADSKISGINVPFSGEHALVAVRESGGVVAGVTDEAAFAMQRRLAREEGLWVEPASAVTAAALALLMEKGEIRETDRVVCVFTGAGFKDIHLAEPEAAAVSGQAPVPYGIDTVIDAVSR